MAAPNLLAPSTITGKTVVSTPANTNATTLLTNAASSGKAMKVNSIIVTNTTGTAAVITLQLYSAATSGNPTVLLANTLSVAANTAVTLMNRDNSVWLEEDRRLSITVGTATALSVVCSYEEIA